MTSLQNYDLLFTILPIVYTLLFFILFCQYTEWRESLLLSSMTWGITVTAITEGLSLFKEITFIGLALAWIGLDIFAGIILAVKLRKDGLKLFRKQIPDFETFDYLTLGGIAVIIFITGVIAFMAPPNTWDLMTYHMSRVMHWIQDKSVSPFPTSISRQYILLHGANSRSCNFNF